MGNYLQPPLFILMFDMDYSPEQDFDSYSPWAHPGFMGPHHPMMRETPSWPGRGRHGRGRHGGWMRRRGPGACSPRMHPRFHHAAAWEDEEHPMPPFWSRGGRHGFGGFGCPPHKRGHGIGKPHKHGKHGKLGGKKFLKMRVFKLEQQVQMLQEQIEALSQE